MQLPKDDKTIFLNGDIYVLGTPNIIAIGFDMSCRYIICSGNSILRDERSGKYYLHTPDGGNVWLDDADLSIIDYMVETPLNRVRMAEEVTKRNIGKF
jgi:hypothetical protein